MRLFRTCVDSYMFSLGMLQSLKSRNLDMDLSSFKVTQLDPGDSGLSGVFTLQHKINFLSKYHPKKCVKADRISPLCDVTKGTS